MEAALQMFLQGNSGIDLKVGGITERVNAGDERMRRMEEDKNRMHEETQLWKKKLDVLVNAGGRTDLAA